ncbi:hypothetical protein D3C77_679100 [compost metagenome]
MTTNQTQAQILAEIKAQCDTWNHQHQIGTLVAFEAVPGSGETQRVKSTSKAMGWADHSAVIWLEGMSGCVSLDRCVAIDSV